MTRANAIPGAANVIKVTDRHAWVYLRFYVPNEADGLSGQAFMGGVPLPTIKLYEFGKAVPEIVQPCPLKPPQPSQDYYPVRSMNKFADVRALLQLWFPDGSDLDQASDHDDVLPNDRIWFAPPWNPPMLLMPNPDNKYLVAIPGPYQKDRLIVIRARFRLAAEYYDKILFEQKTFQDMAASKGPMVHINATDMVTGIRVALSSGCI